MQRLLFILPLLAINLLSYGQTSLRAGIIAFYNLENLFDTIDTEGVDDFEFTPLGPNKWNAERYQAKLGNLARVILAIGEEEGVKGGPAILGVCEIENRSVLEDLAAHPMLKASNYQVVHYESPDLRGVDVGLLYRPRYFRVTSTDSRVLNIRNENNERVYTRDQLVVTGIFDGEEMSFIVNHWPSRSSGEQVTRPRRNEAAMLTRRIVDSLTAINPDAKIVVMGDLNDDPSNESLRKYLRAGDDPDRLKDGELFNCMYPLFKKGIGSLYYRDGLNLFDQIIISKPLTGKDFTSYRFYGARVFNKQFLLQQDGQYRDYPLRTYVGTTYTGGYSDHFPVYLIIARENR